MKNISPPCKFSLLKAEGGTNSVNRKCNPPRRSCMSSARNAGESAIGAVRAQPSAEIVRVECAKCRRECDLSHARATLCGDRACRVREMQARVRFVSCPRNPLRRSCVSSARNAGESGMCPVPVQPSAEIVRVERAKRRRECDWRGPRANIRGDRACQVREMQARMRLARSARNPLRRSCVSSARNAGESAICPMPAQPSAEIVRVECAKRRRECDLSHARATLCGDRACRVRETQARVRCVRCPRNPLRRSCVSSARNAGERAICPVRAQPSAEIARVERAKRRRECNLPHARATVCRDRARRVREMQARVRLVRSARKRSRVSSARNAGESAIGVVRAQPSAEIVRVERAKWRRECDWRGPRATLCRGDRACRAREMQARVRFVRCARDPLRRSRVSSARNAGTGDFLVLL